MLTRGMRRSHSSCCLQVLRFIDISVDCSCMEMAELLWKALSQLPKLTTLGIEAELYPSFRSFGHSYLFNDLDRMTQIR